MLSQMIRFTVGVLVAVLVPAASGQKFDQERAALYNACKPMIITVTMDSNFTKGIEKQAVEVLAERRLRAARIYRDQPPENVIDASQLSIMVMGTEPQVFTILNFNKLAMDVHGNMGLIDTWQKLQFSRNNLEFVVDISEGLDQFVSEYLRINADACN